MSDYDDLLNVTPKPVRPSVAREPRRLRLEQHELHPHSARVWLNDVEISHFLTGIEISWSLTEFTQASLKITVDELDVDAETIAMLQAQVKPTAEPFESETVLTRLRERM